jgi:hypothetical protein
LAVRAARRALAVNPEDAHSYLVLGESYLRLLHDTRERAWQERMPELAQLRRVQASTALNQAIRKDLPQAHLELGRLYREVGFYDLALEHLRAHFKLVHEAGPPPGSSVEEFREQEARYEDDVSRLAKGVEDREKEYEAAAVRFRVLDRATLALDKGLAGKARDLLLETTVTAFGAPGMAVELGLLLRTGQAKEVLEWTGPEQKASLDPTVYHRLRLHALAALGDYAGVQEEAEQLALDNWGPAPRLREGMAQLLAQAILGRQPVAGAVPTLLWGAILQAQLHGRVMRITRDMRQKADLLVLQGLLALEEGDVDQAEIFFRLALTWWKDQATAASGAGLEFGGRVIAQDCLEWLK